jgi:transposase
MDEGVKEVAVMIRKHFNGIDRDPPAHRLPRSDQRTVSSRIRGYTRFQTMRTVLFLIAGKLNFSEINPHTA